MRRGDCIAVAAAGWAVPAKQTGERSLSRSVRMHTAEESAKHRVCLAQRGSMFGMSASYLSAYRTTDTRRSLLTLAPDFQIAKRLGCLSTTPFMLASALRKPLHRYLYRRSTQQTSRAGRQRRSSGRRHCSTAAPPHPLSQGPHPHLPDASSRLGAAQLTGYWLHKAAFIALWALTRKVRCIPLMMSSASCGPAWRRMADVEVEPVSTLTTWQCAGCSAACARRLSAALSLHAHACRQAMPSWR